MGIVKHYSDQHSDEFRQKHQQQQQQKWHVREIRETRLAGCWHLE